MLGGTTLYSAEALEVNEWNLKVLMLLYFEDPSGRMQEVPCREVSRKSRFTAFGMMLL